MTERRKTKPHLLIHAGACGYIYCQPFDETDINDPLLWARIAESIRRGVQELNAAYMKKHGGASIFH